MQRRRLFFQLGFFALFLLAPALDLLRFDLNEAQLWFLGQRWSLGIDAFKAGEITANEAAIRIFLRAFLPAIVVVVAFLGVAWRYGRLYCGWLCPFGALQELTNNLAVTLGIGIGTAVGVATGNLAGRLALQSQSLSR